MVQCQQLHFHVPWVIYKDESTTEKPYVNQHEILYIFQILFIPWKQLLVRTTQVQMAATPRSLSCLLSTYQISL